MQNVQIKKTYRSWKKKTILKYLASISVEIFRVTILVWISKTVWEAKHNKIYEVYPLLIKLVTFLNRLTTKKWQSHSIIFSEYTLARQCHLLKVEPFLGIDVILNQWNIQSEFNKNQSASFNEESYTFQVANDILSFFYINNIWDR